MKIAALSWRGNNIGDDVQTVAVMRHLPGVDLFLNREDLATYDGEDCLLVMNGWFMDHPERWPPSDRIKPVFFGFHVNEALRPQAERHADYLRAHEPIGCRDRGTRAFLESIGVRAYLSLCATLTFEPAPEREARDLYWVEVDPSVVSRPLRRNHGFTEKRVSHRFVDVPLETRLAYARDLVETYRRQAAVVVTSRIHCAMPCAAMGIPVAYFGPINYRTEVLEEIGLRRRSLEQGPSLFGDRRMKAWPEPLDLSELRAKITADLRARIGAMLESRRLEEAQDAVAAGR